MIIPLIKCNQRTPAMDSNFLVNGFFRSRAKKCLLLFIGREPGNTLGKKTTPRYYPVYRNNNDELQKMPHPARYRLA